MARAIWSGSIAFGMVSIPVKLYGATESKDISFHLLHATDATRLKQLRWCPTDEREVPWSEIVRGYEYAKDQYVTLTEEDFENLPLPSKHTIELNAFVKADEIDPVYYERSYHLAPDERAEKAYTLLIRTLEKKGLTAIANITIRKKEQLCVLRPKDGALMLESDSGVFRPRGFGFTGAPDARATLESIALLLRCIGADRIGPSGGGPDIGPSVAMEQIPAMSLETDESKYFLYHHTAADTVDKLDALDMARCAAAVAIVAYVVADLPQRLGQPAGTQ